MLKKILSIWDSIWFEPQSPASLCLFRICYGLLVLENASLWVTDHLFGKKRGTAPEDPWQIRSSCWTQRLLQLQLSAVYCQAFFVKTNVAVWQNGTAIYYISKLEEMARLPVPFFFDHLWTCQLLTWGAMAIELSMFTLIWFKPLRYYVLIAAVA